MLGFFCAALQNRYWLGVCISVLIVKDLFAFFKNLEDTVTIPAFPKVF